MIRRKKRIRRSRRKKVRTRGIRIKMNVRGGEGEKCFEREKVEVKKGEGVLGPLRRERPQKISE